VPIIPREDQMIGTTRLYLAAFPSVTALIYQPPHPLGASNGPNIKGTDMSTCHRKLYTTLQGV